MRIGVVVPMAVSDGPGHVPTWPQVRTFGQHAEAVGLHSVWVCDHLLPARPTSGSTRAGRSSPRWPPRRARRARPAGRLHRLSAPGAAGQDGHTADEISGGRLILGLGAGCYDLEYRAFGYPTDHRVGRFEEAIGIIGPLLRGERVTLAGSYYQVRDAVLRPPPDRPIPLLVAARVGACSG